MTQKPLFLIDGSSFLYRAYHGTRPLTTSKGVSVQAVYGFARMIKKIIKDFNITHIAIVWDSKGPTKRHEIFDGYKANRQAPPADLFTQKELITQICTSLDICQISQQGIEADDLIFSIAKQMQTNGHKVVIVSSDKDLAQVVDERITIYDPFTNQELDKGAFETKYGFALERLPLYFSLLGDSSDNIPGVKGIGQKGATQLAMQFASLQELYDNIDQIEKEKTRQLLLQDKENAFLSLQLFTLHYYPQQITFEQTAFHNTHWQKALPLFTELEFKSLIKEISTEPSTRSSESNAQATKQLHELYEFSTITTTQQLANLCTQIEKAGHVAIDTETDGLNEINSSCVGISFAFQVGSAYYLPFGHETGEVQLDLATVQKYLQPLFANPHIKKYMHHAKFDALILHHQGLPVKGIHFDTLIAASLLRPEEQKNGLKVLSEYYFNEPMISYEEIMKKNLGSHFGYVPLEQATWYAAADAHQTLKLYELFAPMLEEQELAPLFYTIEMPTAAILIQMQLDGIYCNKEKLAEALLKINHDLEQLSNKIFAYAGTSINLNSPKQVNELLFGTLGLPTQKKSAKKTGYSTDAQVLTTLAKLHPVAQLLLEYRELFKLKSTYIEGLQEYINPRTGKIHTSFNQTQVATGRLSSSNPNLQNIPASSNEYAIDIKSSFQPEPGYVFIAADYSQIELRILAQFCQDSTLLEAFSKGQDIHTKTAAKIFHTTENEITNEQRAIGKKINFSILYGLTAYGLSKDLTIPVKDAQLYIETYFNQYSRIKEWMHTVVESTKKLGYTTTWYKRRRYLPGIYERNQHLYHLAERIAINTPVQGTAAEIMKLGMIKLQKAFHTQQSSARMLLQIHDELLITVKQEEATYIEELTRKTLESVVSWSIPLTVQTKQGKNWHEVSK